MIQFDEYASYKLIPKDFDGTIILKIKLDKNGDPIIPLDETITLFEHFQKEFPNNKVVCTIEGYADIEGILNGTNY